MNIQVDFDQICHKCNETIVEPSESLCQQCLKQQHCILEEEKKILVLNFDSVCHKCNSVVIDVPGYGRFCGKCLEKKGLCQMCRSHWKTNDSDFCSICGPLDRNKNIKYSVKSVFLTEDVPLQKALMYSVALDVKKYELQNKDKLAPQILELFLMFAAFIEYENVNIGKVSNSMFRILSTMINN